MLGQLGARLTAIDAPFDPEGGCLCGAGRACARTCSSWSRSSRPWPSTRSCAWPRSRATMCTGRAAATITTDTIGRMPLDPQTEKRLSATTFSRQPMMLTIGASLPIGRRGRSRTEMPFGRKADPAARLHACGRDHHAVRHGLRLCGPLTNAARRRRTDHRISRSICCRPRKGERLFAVGRVVRPGQKN